MQTRISLARTGIRLLSGQVPIALDEHKGTFNEFFSTLTAHFKSLLATYSRVPSQGKTQQDHQSFATSVLIPAETDQFQSLDPA